MTEPVAAEVFPPGDFIAEELDARGWTRRDLAERLGCSLCTVQEIIAGKQAISPETAKGLGAAFGTGAQLWLNLESSFRRQEGRGYARESCRKVETAPSAGVECHVPGGRSKPG